jgi:tetratricopeptide (TPR) repeat protein
MEKPRKNVEKFRALVVTSLLVLGATACESNSSKGGESVDRGDAKAAAERIAEADTFYEGRDDINKARMAVTALRRAQTSDYGNYEAAWKLARAAFYVGDHTDTDSERDDMFREGTAAGKVAIQLQPDKPEGHFWLGANYGGTAQHSTLANLSSFQDIRDEMETVLKIDESYQGYSAYLGLGRLYWLAPRVLGGDTEKAIEYLEKGVKLNPDHSLMRFHLAEAYESNNRDAEAKKQIETLMAMTPDPAYVAEHKTAMEKGKQLLEKIGSRR